MHDHGVHGMRGSTFGACIHILWRWPMLVLKLMNRYTAMMQDVCEKAKGGQSHTAHRVVAFEPYAPAALFLRIALALLVIKGEQLRLTFTPVHTLFWLISSSLSGTLLMHGCMQ